MNTSDRLLLAAIGLAAVITGGLAWFFEGAGPWWVYLIVWLFFASVFWQGLLTQKAKENVANLNDKKRDP
tara:strand:+ start:5738 stop:5947 length:210 start_codon:yes stop_codon:yes gene_type:complete